jgi:hypothetical protein
MTSEIPSKLPIPAADVFRPVFKKRQAPLASESNGDEDTMVKKSKSQESPKSKQSTTHSRFVLGASEQSGITAERFCSEKKDVMEENLRDKVQGLASRAQWADIRENSEKVRKEREEEARKIAAAHDAAHRQEVNAKIAQAKAQLRSKLSCLQEEDDEEEDDAS